MRRLHRASTHDISGFWKGCVVYLSRAPSAKEHEHKHTSQASSYPSLQLGLNDTLTDFQEVGLYFVLGTWYLAPTFDAVIFQL